MQLPFGPYRPDLAATNPSITATAVNVNPRRDLQGLVSYHPRQGFAGLGGDALPAAPRGGLAVVTRSGLFKGYFGTAAELYSLDSDYGFTAIGAGTYTVPTGDQWSMAQYGDNLIATNTSDGMFAYDIETPAGVNAISGAPDARYVFVAFECVFALDCDGDNRIMKNSAPGSFSNWTTQGAGFQEFPDGEALMGGGSINEGTAAVLQGAAVHLLRVAPDERVYTRQKLADGIGAVNPWSIVQAPGAIYFIDNNGPMRVTAGGLEHIGQDKVSRTFMTAVGDVTTIDGAYDPGRRQVAWRYDTGSGNEVFSNILVFDLATEEFVLVTEQTTALLKMSSPALSLDDFGAAGFGDLDSLEISLDSDAWKGGRPRLAALDADRKFGFFDGENLAAQVDTATLTDSRSMLVTAARPITDAAGITLNLGVRDRLADTVTFKGAESMQASGWVRQRGRGMCLIQRAEIPAGATWSYLRGIEKIDMVVGGPR